MQRASPGATGDAAQSRAADSGVKGMIPFRRPFLDYVLSALADAGFLVVRYDERGTGQSGGRLDALEHVLEKSRDLLALDRCCFRLTPGAALFRQRC